MVIKANIKEAARSLYFSKQRTILALIGIIIGIGSVIAMISIGKIVEDESMRQFIEMGTDILTIRKDFVWDSSGKPDRSSPIQLNDALGILSNCPSIESSAPFVSLNGEVSYNGKKIDGNSLLGVTQSFAGLNKLKLREGRFISDLDERSHFCVVGNSIYRKIMESGKTCIGEKIKFGDGIFTIVGVIQEVPGGGMMQFDANESIYAHITTAMRMRSDAEISTITARIKPGIAHIAAQDQIKEYFKKKTKIKNIRITSPEDMIKQMEKQMRLFTLLLGAIGSISLIVGGVGVMNIMLVSVNERRKEIGIRRALGARRGDIKWQFLVEAVMLSMVGGAFGILLGVGISYIVSHYAKWHFIVSYNAILLGVGVSSAVGIFFGFYPAGQASKLDPIIALRSD